MKTRIGILGVTVLVLCAATSTARGDISVRFEPSSPVVNVGQVFTVDILADIPAPDAIIGWGIDTWFNSSILGHDPLHDVAIDPSFKAVFTPDGDRLAGAVPFPPLPLSGTDILLAVLTFEALDVGTSPLIGSYTPTDPTEGFAKPFPPGGFAPASFVDGSVTVIPSPGAAVLGVIGCGFLGVIRRRFPVA